MERKNNQQPQPAVPKVLVTPNKVPVAFTSLQIKNRFKIKEMIDSGGFGSIYTAIDL